VGQHKPSLQKHLSQIAQTQLVPKSPEDNEENNIGGVFQKVEGVPVRSLKAIAGRDLPSAKWDSLHNVMMIVHLDIFTEQEAEAFLDVYKIANARRRAEILEVSGSLPVLMSWLAALEGQEPDSSAPTHDIVERFLRWVTEPIWRQVALVAAIPRTFNVDILKLLLERQDQAIDAQVAFDWLLTMPFVKQHITGCQYHEIVRRMMLRYQRQKSPQVYRQAHTAIANFYNSRRQRLELVLAVDEGWRNEQWRKDTLAYGYHYLVAEPLKHWSEVLSLFVVAMRKHRAFAFEMIELLSQSDVHDELSQEQNDLVQLFRQQLQAIMDESLEDGFTMFDRLCGIADLSPQAKGYVLVYRGECHRLNEKWEQALHDFEEALHYIPDDPWTIARRGRTYHMMERYEEALADFNRAIGLDVKEGEALAQRGEAYRLMRRYQEALADFDRAIALDVNSAELFLGLPTFW
jgi:tetratricopeptide (TPR) repeat protein